MRLDELKQMLLNRNYPIKIIEEAFTKTRKISRFEAIKRVTYKKSSTNKVTFVILFDPKYLKKGHKLITKNTKTSETLYVEQLFPLLN